MTRSISMDGSNLISGTSDKQRSLRELNPSFRQEIENQSDF